MADTGVAVPEALAKHLKGRPLAQQWMVSMFKVKDLETGVPVSRWPHEVPPNPVRTLCHVDALNNWRSLPNAIVLVQGQEVLVHSLVIERVCLILASSWKPGYSCKTLRTEQLVAAAEDSQSTAGFELAISTDSAGHSTTANAEAVNAVSSEHSSMSDAEVISTASTKYSSTSNAEAISTASSEHSSTSNAETVSTPSSEHSSIANPAAVSASAEAISPDTDGTDTDSGDSDEEEEEAGRINRLNICRHRTATLHLECAVCKIPSTDYTTGYMFLEFLYRGELTWPGTGADAATASQLVVLANFYGLPLLVAEVEIVFRTLVNIASCCEILQTAAHHNAEKLEDFCLRFIASARTGSIAKADLNSLDDELKAKLEDCGWKGLPDSF